MNYINTLRFTPLSDSKQTFVHWEGRDPLMRDGSQRSHGCCNEGGFEQRLFCTGEFWTDSDMADTMRELLANFYQEALGSLEKQINEGKRNGMQHLEGPQPYSQKDPASEPSCR